MNGVLAGNTGRNLGAVVQNKKIGKQMDASFSTFYNVKFQILPQPAVCVSPGNAVVAAIASGDGCIG